MYAIAGYKNSGKDTAAKMLQYLLNTPKFMHKYSWFKYLNRIFIKPYIIVSFANPLKKTLAALMNIPVEKFNDRNFKENTYVKFPELIITKKPKDILSDSKFDKCLNSNSCSFLKSYYLSIRQVLQVFGTEIMRKFFGDTLWIHATLNNSDKLIISDLRFKVEFEEVKKRNCICIFINNNKAKAGKHASEREVKELLDNNRFDFIINNNSSLEDMFNQLSSII